LREKIPNLQFGNLTKKNIRKDAITIWINLAFYFYDHVDGQSYVILCYSHLIFCTGVRVVMTNNIGKQVINLFILLAQKESKICA
jgi:hypothetical protein